MSFNWEALLIGKVMRDGVGPALDAKITADYFHDDQQRMVWEYIISHWQEYGEEPSARTLKANFPSYRLLAVDEPYGQILEELRQRRRLEIAVEMATNINSSLADDDVEAALEAVAQGLLEINTQASDLRDIDLVETWESDLELYSTPRDNPDELLGWPTGFPTIDKVTEGLQAEQLITLVGLPKRAKSLMSMKIAKSVHEAGGVPLYVSFEMSAAEQSRRLHAMMAGISTNVLKRRELTTSQKRKLREALEKFSKMQPFILSTDITSGTTVTGLAAKIEQYKPDVLFVDGSYLMDDELGEKKGSPQALTNITRSLKRLAQRRRLPVFITTQALIWKYNKSRGIAEDTIGYTSSFLQDSDVVFGVDNTDEPDIKLLRLMAGRDVQTEEVAIRANWDTFEFEELEDYTPSADEEGFAL